LRPRERMEEFPLLPREREDRHEGEDDDAHREEDGAADWLGGFQGDAEVVWSGEPCWERGRLARTSRMRARRLRSQGFLRNLAVANDILDHHDAGIDQHADRDGDAGERHDVRLDAEL